jgi:hypothetical protein
MNFDTITSPSQKKEGMNTRKKVFMALALVVVLVVGAVGRLTSLVTPQEEIEATSVAIERARSFQAEHYEPDLLQKAQSDFRSAVAEVSEQNQKIKFLRSYGNVEQLLASAKVAAQEAYEGSVAKQKEARAAHAAIDLAKIEIKATSNLLKWEYKKFSRADVREMEETLEVLESELKDAERLLSEEDYAGAKSMGVSISHQINEISGRIREAT